jgi:hypothetical protein
MVCQNGVLWPQKIQRTFGFGEVENLDFLSEKKIQEKNLWET